MRYMAGLELKSVGEVIIISCEMWEHMNGLNYISRFRNYRERKQGMISKNIILKNQKEIIEFISIIERYPYSIMISEGHCTMNAKSILGMLAISFHRIMTMNIHSDSADDLLEAVSKFICNEYRQVG